MTQYVINVLHYGFRDFSYPQFVSTFILTNAFMNTQHRYNGFSNVLSGSKKDTCVVSDGISI